VEVDKHKGRPKLGAIQLLLAAFLCLVIVLSLAAPNFLTFANITNVLRQVSMIAIMAVGMTMVILTGEIDLSVGSMVAFSGVVFAWLAVEAELSYVLAALITLVMGAGIGLLIGCLQTRFNVPSFIITLGLFQALRSAGYVVTNAFPIAPLPDNVAWLGRGVVAGIPVPVVLMIIAYVMGFFLLNKTTWGRAIYAVGSNAVASELSGLDTRKIKMSVFAINSLLAALAGLILASRLNSGTPTVATGWELDVIAAVIIGGTAMSGGSGNILGTLLGAMFVAVLNNGMILMGVSPYVQGVISGLVIVVAVLIGSKNKKRS
jgi:ribose/xylose/arabinose/galactoside ABC-type transport system permease subunit